MQELSSYSAAGSHNIHANSPVVGSPLNSPVPAEATPPPAATPEQPWSPAAAEQPLSPAAAEGAEEQAVMPTADLPATPSNPVLHGLLFVDSPIAEEVREAWVLHVGCGACTKSMLQHNCVLS